MPGELYNAAVIVTSDTCFNDPDADESGPFVVSQLKSTNLFEEVHREVVPDEEDTIVSILEQTISDLDLALVITVGGTGLCPRDVTPEATTSLYDKHCSGITVALHAVGQRYSSHAALSRLTSGIIGRTLVVNLPGSLKACKDYMSWMCGILEHALEQVRGDMRAYSATHKLMAANSAAGDQPSLGSSSPSPVGCHNRSTIFKIPALALIEGAPPAAATPAAAKSTPRNPSKKPGPTKRTVYYQKRASSLVSNASRVSSVASSRLTIDAIMESRSELPLEEPQRPPRPTVRSLASRISPLMPNGTAAATTNLPKVRIMPLKSSFPMIDFEAALDILESMSDQVLGASVEVDIANHQRAMYTLGSVLARELKPQRSVPPHACSTMDGYVLNIPKSRKSDVETGKLRQVPSASLLAGGLEEFERKQRATDTSEDFFCYQVNTGGRLPWNGYAVIPTEKAELLAGTNQVAIQEIRAGAYVRRAGADVNKNDALPAGTVLGPVEMAVIMMMGHSKVEIFHKPKVGVLSTGDELRNFFEGGHAAIGDDDVVDTNGPLLTAMLNSRGYPAVNLGVARDEPDHILAKLQEALRKCDIVLVTGGASMGTRDHVKSVIVHLGGKIHFGRVNMKPGKPVAFASIKPPVGRTKFIFSLPGNPVSAYMTTTVLVLPFIQHGIKSKSRPENAPKAKINFDSVGDRIDVEVKEFADGNEYPLEDRPEFIRAKIVARKPAGEVWPAFAVRVSVKQQSSRMLSLVDCDCLIMMNPEKHGRRLLIGQTYPALRLHRAH